MAKTLAERATSYRATDRCTITDLQNIIPELREAVARALDRKRTAEAESVDLALDAEARDEAAAEASRSGRLAQGYTEAIADLEAKLAAKLAGEGRRRKEAEQAAALAERDELAERFKATVPDLVAELAAIFAEVDANEKRMHDSGLREATAEAVARGLPSGFNLGGVELRRFTRMVIPGWDTDSRAWPPVLANTLYGGDYDKRMREQQRQIRSEAAEYEAATFGWYRLKNPGLGHAVSFTVCVMLSEGRPSGHSKKQSLWKQPWAGQIAHTEAERLRQIGVNVEEIDQATAEAETAAAAAKAIEGMHFPDARRSFS